MEAGIGVMVQRGSKAAVEEVEVMCVRVLCTDREVVSNVLTV